MEFEDYSLDLHGVRLPKVKVDESDYKKVGIKDTVSNEKFLRLLCEFGLNDFISKGIIANSKKDEYEERVKYELEILKETGFLDYIILIWDIINFCKKEKIPTGAGRGSAAGSLVLFLIGVTAVDPIKYSLYFERFVSKTRARKINVDGIEYIDGLLAPDVDLDICHEDRHRVVEHLKTKYEDRCCKLATYFTLQTKAVVKECGKIVLEMPNEEVEHLAKQVPSLFGKVFSLEKAQEQSEDFNTFCSENSKFFTIAKKLHGLVKNKSSHPSGYLISYDKETMRDLIPRERSSSGEEVLSSFDMGYAQRICIKVDLLGLQDITLVSKVCDRVGISMHEIDLDSNKIYGNFKSEIETPYGLFQIGAPTNYSVLKTVKPQNLQQLAGVVSLARPGALAYVDQYRDYVQKGEAQSVHKFFDDVLEESGGIPLYQEQAMRMANKIGFTLEESETLRRIVGKKKVEEMKIWEEKVHEKIKEQNLDPEIGDVLWKVLSESANYSFNKSHAVSYAMLSATSVYLKFQHPLEFFAEALNLAQNRPNPLEEIAEIQRELTVFGIKLLPPDLIYSEMQFTIKGKDLRYGLSSIKGISSKSINGLNQFISHDRSNKFKVFNAARSSGLSIGILSALIQAGTLDSQLVTNRPALVFEAQLWNLLTPREKEYALQHGEEYNYSTFSLVKDMDNWLTDSGNKFIRKGRLETLKTKAEPLRKIYYKNSKYPELANFIYESNLLGYSPSTTLRETCKDAHPRKLSNALEFISALGNDSIDMAGEVLEASSTISKAGNPYFKIILSDESGKVTCMFFNPKLEKWKEKHELPKKGERVIVSGNKWNDLLSINDIRTLDKKIYMKLSELNLDEI